MGDEGGGVKGKLLARAKVEEHMGLENKKKKNNDRREKINVTEQRM